MAFIEPMHRNKPNITYSVIISWHVPLSIFTGVEFWAGYINPKTGFDALMLYLSLLYTMFRGFVDLSYD